MLRRMSAPWPIDCADGWAFNRHVGDDACDKAAALVGRCDYSQSHPGASQASTSSAPR